MTDKQIPLTKPLSDDDVDEIRRRLAKADPKELNDIFNVHSQLLNAVLTTAIKQTKDEDEIVEIERIKRLINLAPIDERFVRSKDKIWNVRNQILEKNTQWFLDRDYSSLVKKDHNQATIETIMSIIRDKFHTLSKAEMDHYWNKAIALLQNVARYKKLVGES
jgi:hypothetical protein